MPTQSTYIGLKKLSSICHPPPNKLDDNISPKANKNGDENDLRDKKVK